MIHNSRFSDLCTTGTRRRKDEHSGGEEASSKAHADLAAAAPEV
jgi:hypothetical protein